MIADFADTLLVEIDKDIKNETDRLVSADGTSRHDLIRGRISALKDTRERILRQTRTWAQKEAA